MNIYMKAPAKVNLYLKITGKREDGYHEIISIFQMISLYDILNIRTLNNSHYCTIKGNFSFQDKDNTIMKAVKLFMKKTGISTGLSIKVDKVIPEGAGLGGGSTDAAATLMALNILFKTNLNRTCLIEMAMQIGSDVPFFLGSACAIVTGRGEKISPLKPRTDFSIVMIYPGFSVSTREAYKWWDADRRSEKNEIYSSEELRDMYEKELVERWVFTNSFTKIVSNANPLIFKIINILTKAGAVFAGLSGSGSVVIGIFKDYKFAQSAARRLNKTYSFVKCVTPLDIKPEFVLR